MKPKGKKRPVGKLANEMVGSKSKNVIMMDRSLRLRIARFSVDDQLCLAARLERLAAQLRFVAELTKPTFTPETRN